jgi:hypothetical protein
LGRRRDAGPCRRDGDGATSESRGRGERKRHRTIDFDGGEPAATTFTPLLPATNTVRFGGADGTALRLPVSAAGSP